MKKIVIFASGSGSNFEALAEACREGIIPAKVVALVCDRPGAGVIERAAKFEGIEVLVVNPRVYPDKRSYEEKIIEALSHYEIDLVCLAGYMRICGPTLLKAFSGKMINIHPSLLPSFKGATPIKDALEFGVKVFGVTIHYVNETLDGGKIISQAALPYLGNDLEELTAKIHGLEHPLYIETVKNLLGQ